MIKITIGLIDIILIAIFFLLWILYFGLILASILKMKIKYAIDKFKRERKANEHTEDRVD